MAVLVSRPVVQEGLISLAEIDQNQYLAGIMKQLDGNFVKLAPKQSNTLNTLLRSRCTDVPSDTPEIQDNIGKFGVRDATSFHPKLGLAVEQHNLASVLFLDLDHFKSVNDRYDHATGDQVIREALGVVENVIQQQGELFHRSGDEMIVLLPNSNNSAGRETAERIRSAIEQKSFSVIGQGLVTTTIGLATYPDHCQRWEDLENLADRTAMQAKKRKKNRVLSYLDKDSEREPLEISIQITSAGEYVSEVIISRDVNGFILTKWKTKFPVGTICSIDVGAWKPDPAKGITHGPILGQASKELIQIVNGYFCHQEKFTNLDQGFDVGEYYLTLTIIDNAFWQQPDATKQMLKEAYNNVYSVRKPDTDKPNELLDIMEKLYGKKIDRQKTLSGYELPITVRFTLPLL